MEGEEQNADEGSGYGIASVYTQPHLRKKGYASHMMRLLHYVIAAPELLPTFPESWGLPPKASSETANGIVSVLYSDVGEEFYAKCGMTLGGVGWRPDSTRTTVWEVSGSGPNTDLGEVEWLNELSMQKVLEEEEPLIFQEIARVGGGTRFSFLPADHQVEFQVERSKLTPGLPLDKQAKWGAKCSNAGSDFATWTYEARPAPSRLILTRLRASVATLEILIAAAIKAAEEQGMETVEVWGFPEELVQAAQDLGGKTFSRGEHIPSVRWYRKGDVKWVYNEK